MKLSESQKALVAKVKQTVSDIAAAETECLLNGSITRFHSIDGRDADRIRTLAKSHGVTLPC